MKHTPFKSQPSLLSLSLLLGAFANVSVLNYAAAGRTWYRAAAVGVPCTSKKGLPRLITEVASNEEPGLPVWKNAFQLRGACSVAMKTWSLTACECGYTANHLLSHTAERHVLGSAVKWCSRYTVDGSLYRKLKPNHGQGSFKYMFEEDMTRRGGPSTGQSCGAARAARHIASLLRKAEGTSRLLLRCALHYHGFDVQRFKSGWERGRGGCGLREERRATCTVCQWPDIDAALALDQVRVGAASRAASMCHASLQR